MRIRLAQSIIIFLAPLSLAGQAVARADAPGFEYRAILMGCTWRIVLHGAQEREAAASAALAFQRVRELERALSDYDPESELRSFERRAGDAVPTPLGFDLLDALHRARRFAELSEGAFDPTIGPLVRLWRGQLARGKVPPPGAVATARQLVDWRALELHLVGRTGRLTRPGMSLDLGGLAKGLAAEEALHVLQRRGHASALVDGGGGIAVGAPPPGAAGWRIELTTRRSEDEGPAEAVLLAHASIATSGDLVRQVVIDDRPYGHLLDPRTGSFVPNGPLVTVIACRGATADAWATACSIMPAEEALRRTSQLAGVLVRIEAANGEIHASPGFAAWLAPVR